MFCNCCLGFYHWIWNNTRPDSILIDELLHQFSLASIKKSTKNFDKNQIIGNESLGIVYRGCLQSHNGTNDYAVMIKRVSPITDQISRGFQNEIELQCQLVHPNFLSYLGYCDHKNEKIIVYDYNSNGSLHNRLCCIHNGIAVEPLAWKQRLKICIGAACGLHFLHNGTKHSIIHGNIQSHKILLDSNMVPKLSDLWISLQGPVRDNNSSGTNDYYVAPEMLVNNIVTEKCDVYSLGIVLLEVICMGKLEIVKQQRQPMEESIDESLVGNIAPECWKIFVDVTKRCLKNDPNERPNMGEVEVLLELALTLQEEADNNKNNVDDPYTLLSKTIIDE